MMTKWGHGLVIAIFAVCVAVGVYTFAILTQDGIYHTQAEEADSTMEVLNDATAKYDVQGKSLDGPSSYISVNVQDKADISKVKTYLENHFSKEAKEQYQIDVFT